MTIKPSVNLDALFKEIQAAATAGQTGLEFRHRFRYLQNQMDTIVDVWSTITTISTGPATVFDVSALSFQGSTKDLKTDQQVRWFSAVHAGGSGTGDIAFFNSTTELAKMIVRPGFHGMLAINAGEMFGSVLDTFEVTANGSSMDLEIMLATASTV